MKKVKEPAPHEKAAQIEKEAVRALSVDEVEEALTKSTYGAPEVKKADKYIEDLEDEILTVRAAYSALEGKYAKLERENKKLSDTIKELRAINEEWANSDEQKTIKDLKDEISELNNILIKVRQENKDLTKTISKMKYTHDEEVRALEDDLAEAKILCKKANEYSSLLDDDSCAFERILNLTDTLKCQAEAIRGVVSLIENETEARV